MNQKTVISILYFAVTIVLIVITYTFIQLGNKGIIGRDGYYHIRHAELLRLAGPALVIPFPWLPLTILNPEDFTNHHLLFHVFLMPFTFGDLIIGAKIATVLFAAGATLTWFLIARAQSVKWPIFWLLALYASSSDFLYRLSMTRRQSLVLLLLLLAVHLVLKRRLKWLIVLGFTFAWLYDGWIMLLAVVGIASLGIWIEKKRIDLAVLLAPLGGLVLGTIANPFFPNNLIFSIRHLLPKLNLYANYLLRLIAEWIPYSPKALLENIRVPMLRVGNEWSSYSAGALLENVGFALILAVFGFVVTLWFIRGKQRVDAKVIAWGSCTLFLTGLMLVSKRFAEYQPAFAIMFAAITWSALIKTERAQRFFVNLKKLLYPAWIVTLAIVISITGYNLIDARHKASTDPPSTKYAGAARFLAENSLPGERIFTSGWDEFPWLFFHNTKNTYLVGLDPYYMYQYDPNLYWRWEAITQGEEANPSEEISNRFASRFVFIDRLFESFLERARKDSNMQQVYKDEWATIFKIKDLP